MHDFVGVNTGTWFQYNSIRASKFVSLKWITSSPDEVESVFEVIDHSIPEVVSAIPETYFFECFSLEKDVYFYNAISALPSPIHDIFDMYIIYTPECVVNWDIHTYQDVTLDVPSTCPVLSASVATYVASSMESINFYIVQSNIVSL